MATASVPETVPLVVVAKLPDWAAIVIFSWLPYPTEAKLTWLPLIFVAVTPVRWLTALKAEAMSSSAVQAMLDVFPAEIRDVEEM